MNKYLKEAIEQYEQKIESGEPFYMDASVLMDIEDYYEKEGKSYDAERLMRFAEKLHPDSEDVLVVKAYRLKLSGKWSEALSLIKSIPNQLNRDVQLFYAEWDVASGRPQKAETRIASCLPAQITMEDYDWYLDFAERNTRKRAEKREWQSCFLHCFAISAYWHSLNIYHMRASLDFCFHLAYPSTPSSPWAM